MLKVTTGVVLGVVAFAGISFAATNIRAEVVIETKPVGNPGNPNHDIYNLNGGVDYVYNIGTFEVTAGQYTEFLNAVAAEDPYTLYSWKMSDVPTYWGCNIQRSGTSPNFTYSVALDWADRPVNYVSWGDAARFANWMHNGQPTGAQTLNTTEDGSYYLAGSPVLREPDATWVIPSEDEWYKAAYHKNDGVTGNYWSYPTQSHTAPSYGLPPGLDMTNGTANYWNGHITMTPYNRNVVGAYDAKPSDSAYGTFDQGGNVREWTEAVFGSDRVSRGGSYMDFPIYLQVQTRSHGLPSTEIPQVGFRLANISTELQCDAMDSDGDGDIDLNDFAAFQNCLTGP